MLESTVNYVLTNSLVSCILKHKKAKILDEIINAQMFIGIR